MASIIYNSCVDVHRRYPGYHTLLYKKDREISRFVTQKITGGFSVSEETVNTVSDTILRSVKQGGVSKAKRKGAALSSYGFSGGMRLRSAGISA